MEIPLNVEVECSDGIGGRALCVIIDPLKDEITHLVVSRPGFAHEERLVPIEKVLETSHTSIKLACTLAELAEMPSFLEAEFIGDLENGAYFWPYSEVSNPSALVVETERIPRDELVIRRGDAVRAQDGPIGRVDEFIIDPHTDSVTHLVMREGHLWGRRDVTIPVADIARFENDTVHLKLSKAEVGALPEVAVKRGNKKQG